jgi:hypothetical protein
VISPREITTAPLRTRPAHRGGSRGCPGATDRSAYLVALLGDRAGWVENASAAGGSAALRHGEREPVRLEEVEPRDRAPILKR